MPIQPERVSFASGADTCAGLLYKASGKRGPVIVLCRVSAAWRGILTR